MHGLPDWFFVTAVVLSHPMTYVIGGVVIAAFIYKITKKNKK